MWEYTPQVKEHFLHPKNTGEIENPDAWANVGNITCGDALYLTLKIDKDTKKIIDAKFKTFGCASAIASSSVLTELIIGKTIDEAKRITNKDIADYLGGLPQEKMHCSVMGQEALEKAISQYLGQETSDHEHYHEEGRIICTCFGVTDELIAKVIRENNLTSVEQVTNYCKAGGGCGHCKSEIEEIISKVQGSVESESALKKPSKPLTNIQKMALIQTTIDREIRPQMEADGGGIDLIDIVGNKVLVALRGTCVGCPSAKFTLKDAVEMKLRELVDDQIIVEEVK